MARLKDHMGQVPGARKDPLSVPMSLNLTQAVWVATQEAETPQSAWLGSKSGYTHSLPHRTLEPLLLPLLAKWAHDNTCLLAQWWDFWLKVPNI